MHVDARSQRSSESGRRDSRPPCVARGLPLNPRAQSEKASRRITVMRRPGRPANPRVIRRRCSLARPLTPGIDEPETTPWPPLRRRELDGSLHPREVTQPKPNERGAHVRSGAARRDPSCAEAGEIPVRSGADEETGPIRRRSRRRGADRRPRRSHRVPRSSRSEGAAHGCRAPRATASPELPRDPPA